MDGENVLEWYHLVRKNEWATNTADQNFKDAYEATEMGDFDQSHPYQSEEQKIHGIGAHEESHALDNASEEQALETEKRERLEYIKENSNVQ